MVDRIQAARTDGTDGIVLNPGERGDKEIQRGGRLLISRRLDTLLGGYPRCPPRCFHSLHRGERALGISARSD